MQQTSVDCVRTSVHRCKAEVLCSGCTVLSRIEIAQVGLLMDGRMQETVPHKLGEYVVCCRSIECRCALRITVKLAACAISYRWFENPLASGPRPAASNFQCPLIFAVADIRVWVLMTRRRRSNTASHGSLTAPEI